MSSSVRICVRIAACRSMRRTAVRFLSGRKDDNINYGI